MKGLDALKDIKQLLSLNQYGGDKDRQVVNDELYTIENELKERDDLAQRLWIITCENSELLKYKQAIEIIKEMFEDEQRLHRLNANSLRIIKEIWNNLSQEKQDLLKEVLV